jgi:hypothetical protein
MEDRIAVLRYAARKGVPSDYIAYDRRKKEYISYKDVVQGARKKRLTPAGAADELAALVLEQASERYERRSLFPLFAWWFSYVTSPATGDASDEMLDAAYLAIRTQDVYADETRIAGAEGRRLYAERVVEPFISQERDLLRIDREQLATLVAYAELRSTPIDEAVRSLAHDLEVTEASSSFTVLHRLPVEQMFREVELDAQMPFVALVHRREDGVLDAKYRMYTAAAEEDISRWFDSISGRIDPTRDPSDKEVPPEMHALILYNQVLRAELEATAEPGEDVEEEEEEAEEEEDDREDTDERELRSVAVERRPIRERERAFTRLTYDGKRFILKVPADVIDARSRQALERFVFRRVKAHGSPQTELVSVKGSFSMFDVAIVPELLLHLISTDTRFSALFYIIELQKSFAEKDRLTLHYESRPDEHVMISFSKLQHAKITDVFRLKGRIVGYNGRRFFTVKLSKATNHVVATTAYDMLLRLFDAYIAKEEELIELYARFFPDVDLAPPPLTTTEKPLTPFEHCKLVAPGIFRRQGRVYQSKSQVTCIATEGELNPSEDDIKRDPVGTETRRAAARTRLDGFLARTHPKKGLRYDVLLYKGIYYTSESAERPFIGFKQTKSTRNVRVPSCYVKPPPNVTRRRMAIGDDGDEFEVVELAPRKKPSTKKAAATKTAKPITTLKILKPGLVGVLTSPINTILTRYGGIDKLHVRLGVPYTANALIHCACIALQLRPYLKADDREAFAWHVRRTELIRYAVATRQEQYDMSTEEIVAELRGTRWLDPRRYYRAIEEWMLARDDGEGSPRHSGEVHGARARRRYRLFMFETTEERGMMVVTPRHKLFHTRDYTEGAIAVILFVHAGQECNNATHEQVELVVSRTKKVRAPEMSYVYDSPELLSTLQALLLESSVVRRIELVEHLGEATQSVVSGTHNVPSALQLFAPLRVVAQQIDSFGKLRAVRLATRDDMSRTVVLLTPPLAPLGLGDTDKVVPEEELRSSRTDASVAAELIGRIRQLSRASGVGGIVSSGEGGVTRALHCYVGPLVDPCTALVVPARFDGAEPVSGVVYVDPRGDSDLEKLQRLKRALPRILAHLEAAYAEEVATTKVKPSGEALVARWTEVRPMYDYRGEAVIGERAVLDSDRLRVWAEGYVDAFLAMGLRLPPSALAPAGEAVGTRVTYVPSTDMLREWHDYLVLTDSTIADELELEALPARYHPYFLRLDGELKIVQMTRRNDQKAALACAFNWITYRVNTGFYSLPIDQLDAAREPGDPVTIDDASGVGSAEVVSFKSGPGKELRLLRFELPNPGVVGEEPREFWAALLSVGTL